MTVIPNTTLKKSAYSAVVGYTHPSRSQRQSTTWPAVSHLSHVTSGRMLRPNSSYEQQTCSTLQPAHRGGPGCSIQECKLPKGTSGPIGLDLLGCDVTGSCHEHVAAATLQHKELVGIRGALHHDIHVNTNVRYQTAATCRASTRLQLTAACWCKVLCNAAAAVQSALTPYSKLVEPEWSCTYLINVHAVCCVWQCSTRAQTHAGQCRIQTHLFDDLLASCGHLRLHAVNSGCQAGWWKA